MRTFLNGLIKILNKLKKQLKLNIYIGFKGLNILIELKFLRKRWLKDSKVTSKMLKESLVTKSLLVLIKNSGNSKQKAINSSLLELELTLLN